MTTIYLDCFSGISGNMMIGALIDAGLPFEYLQTELSKLPISSYRLINKRVTKKGISANYFNVELKRSWFQKSRNLYNVRDIINNSSVSESVKQGAISVFSILAEAEAKVHGIPVDRVHFHEVGAVDCIIDIVGTFIGLEYLGIKNVQASPLHAGGGFVKCQHGRMPVPAPATAELLKGIPFYTGDIKRELVTPTGAAIVATLAKSFGHVSKELKVNKIAYGAGTMDLEIPNVLRIYLGDLESSGV
ncbi:nickel pincer cofactor biosynthesis protein LarC [Pelosinus sp. sgz500959]|uniref:nickel pincer cofactor biosynthesis protein LarC n=1 Tax=Pelosinus sp. sgz500959 TaxID=3242472 RepID=UPI00366F2C58